MIPANTITTTPVTSTFQIPYNLVYNSRVCTTLGGVAISDPSQGRQYQQSQGRARLR